MKRLDSFRAVVCVMARRPGSGSAKTRLSKRLSEGARRDLYEAFLRDKLAQVSLLANAHVAIAVAPPDAPESLEPWTPAGATLFPQRGADLGARLHSVAEDLFAAGAKAVVIVDSDTPTLPIAFLEEAVIALDSGAVDTVFGPAQDGGYYLVGLRQPHAALFEGIPWSTSTVLADSLRVADTLALRTHLLQSWYDVDEPPDLDRLVHELQTMSPFVPGFPRETARRLVGPRLNAEPGGPRTTRQVYADRSLEVTEIVERRGSLRSVVRTGPVVGVLPLVGDRHDGN